MTTRQPSDLCDDVNRTPDVAITAHTRLGQPATITQNGIGTETRTYHPGRGTQASHSYATGHTLLAGKQISWDAPNAYGQPTGYTPSDGPVVAYAWDQGLLHTVTANTPQTFTYAYRPNTAMVQSVTANNGTADTFVQSYPRDIAGRLLAATSAVPGSSPTQLTRHGYRLDDLNRRTRATLLDGSTWTYGYNDRSEVTAATRKQPDDAEVPALGATYHYDDIGNRLTRTSPILGNFGYTSNSTNQYSAITSNDSRTVLGNAPANATVTVNSAPATRIGTLFQKAITAGYSTNPRYLQAAVTDGTTTQTRHFYLPAASTNPAYDLDGNLTNDGQWIYLWDAENRLVSVETTLAAVTAGRPFRKLTFDYDWTNHRLARTVTDGSNTILSTTRWLYDGWNPVAEYSGNVGVSPTLAKTYLWGLDLSGTLQGAGGVGGLLSTSSPITNNPITYNSYLSSYDGNGNITAWTQSGTTTPVARREYDAFGNIIVEQGTPPCAFGFSTKLEDPETGLLYYGHRYYSPPMGSWISQDPIEEEGGLHLYGFVGNEPVGSWDYLGAAVFGVTPSDLHILSPESDFDGYINELKKALDKMKEGGVTEAQFNAAKVTINSTPFEGKSMNDFIKAVEHELTSKFDKVTNPSAGWKMTLDKLKSLSGLVTEPYDELVLIAHGQVHNNEPNGTAAVGGQSGVYFEAIAQELDNLTTGLNGRGKVRWASCFRVMGQDKKTALKEKWAVRKAELKISSDCKLIDLATFSMIIKRQDEESGKFSDVQSDDAYPKDLIRTRPSSYTGDVDPDATQTGL